MSANAPKRETPLIEAERSLNGDRGTSQDLNTPFTSQQEISNEVVHGSSTDRISLYLNILAEHGHVIDRASLMLELISIIPDPVEYRKAEVALHQKGKELERIEPAKSLILRKFGNAEYLYEQARENGKLIVRYIGKSLPSGYDLSTVTLSSKARDFLNKPA